MSQNISKGSGAYCDDNVGGVSCTGHGESIMKICLAKHILFLIEKGIVGFTLL